MSSGKGVPLELVLRKRLMRRFGGGFLEITLDNELWKVSPLGAGSKEALD